MAAPPSPASPRCCRRPPRSSAPLGARGRAGRGLARVRLPGGRRRPSRPDARPAQAGDAEPRHRHARCARSCRTPSPSTRSSSTAWRRRGPTHRHPGPLRRLRRLARRRAGRRGHARSARGHPHRQPPSHAPRRRLGRYRARRRRAGPARRGRARRGRPSARAWRIIAARSARPADRPAGPVDRVDRSRDDRRHVDARADRARRGHAAGHPAGRPRADADPRGARRARARRRARQALRLPARSHPRRARGPARLAAVERVGPPCAPGACTSRTAMRTSIARDRASSSRWRSSPPASTPRRSPTFGSSTAAPSCGFKPT